MQLSKNKENEHKVLVKREFLEGDKPPVHLKHCATLRYINVLNPLTAKCRIYPVQQEYCVRQLPYISGDI